MQTYVTSTRSHEYHGCIKLQRTVLSFIAEQSDERVNKTHVKDHYSHRLKSCEPPEAVNNTATRE